MFRCGWTDDGLWIQTGGKPVNFSKAAREVLGLDLKYPDDQIAELRQRGVHPEIISAFEERTKPHV